MPAALAAAHIAHEIEHTSAFMGFLIGAAVGLAVGVAIVAAAVAAPVTAGASLLVVAAVGGAIATAGGGALAGMKIGREIKNPKGPIDSGSGNVFYGPGRIPAARAVLDTVACQDHGTKHLAQGSDSVFINLYPAVRDTDRSECDGEVYSGLEGIYIGAETVTYMEIQGEVPEWLVNTATWMMWGGTAVALLFGGAAAFVAGSICGLLTFGAVTAFGFVGSIAGEWAGGLIGEALGGDLGRAIGEVAGGILGGFAGGVAGLRVSNRYVTGHPIDVATGEMFTLHDDFLMAGLLPLSWQRFWVSGSNVDGALGHGWHHPLDGMITITPQGAILRRNHGRLVLLPRLAPGECYYHRSERILAMRNADGWVIRDDQNQWHEMAPCPGTPERFLLKTIVDANRNRIAVERDAQDRIVRVIGSDNVEYLFRNDQAGRIVEIAQRAGQSVQRLVSYAYDARGHLITATDAEGASLSYGYNAAHLMERETNRSGYSYHFRWDNPARRTQARCVETWGDDGVFYRRLDYDPDARSTRETDGYGRGTTHWWNERGLVGRTITPMGHETRTEWNKFGERLSVTQPGGGTTVMRHDPYGREIALTTPDGATSTNHFAVDDPADPRFFSISRVVDPAGAEMEVEFDRQANPVATTDPLGYRKTVLRDPRGLPLAIRDDEGVLERFSWTPEGRLASWRSPKGGSIRITYDAFGRIVEQLTEGQGAQKFDTDATGRIVQMTGPDGSRIKLGYDAEGHLGSFTDQAGKRIAWDYGGFGLPLRRTNPDGTQIFYSYDSELNLTGIKNELGEVYALAYDPDQRLVAETEFDGRRREYTPDANGDTIFYRDGRRKHRLSRDPMGRLLRRDSSDGSWADYRYDLVGRMTDATNEVRACTFAYDLCGYVTREVQDGLAIDHVISPRGRRAATFLPDGRFVRFGWDQNDMLGDIAIGARSVVAIDRDRMGRETSRRSGSILQNSDYDPQGRLHRQKAWREGVVSPIFGREYSYGKTGVVSRIEDMARGSTGFRHDVREQLLQVSGADPEHFSFDPAGRLLTDHATSRDASIVRGRLMMRGDSHYSYDDAGNRVMQRRGEGGRIVTTYGYDDMNQLNLVSETAGRRCRETRFAYDALGRRAAKFHREVFVGLQPANDGAAVDDVVTRDDVTRFLWDGDVVLAESLPTRSGTEADALAIVYIHEPDSFRPAAQIRRHSADQEGEVLTYWLDQIGTPVEITNENGKIVWQVALRAWGGVGRTFIEEIENPIRFQGQYHDVETGLHYNRFRHYDPLAGWYLNPDPIACRGGLVLAGYVSDPLGWTDPLGLAGCPSRDLKPDGDPYSGKPQYTRGSFPHASKSVTEAQAIQTNGFAHGTYNRQFNTWARDNPDLNLNAITGKGSTWRPDVIGYNKKTKTLTLVEVVSPSQTRSDMNIKLRTLRAAIQRDNPGTTVTIITTQ